MKYMFIHRVFSWYMEKSVIQNFMLSLSFFNKEVAGKYLTLLYLLEENLTFGEEGREV